MAVAEATMAAAGASVERGKLLPPDEKRASCTFCSVKVWQMLSTPENVQNDTEYAVAVYAMGRAGSRLALM